MAAERVAQPPGGVFVEALEGVFDGEAGADHRQHQMIAAAERVPACSGITGGAIIAPVLGDRSSIGEPGRRTTRGGSGMSKLRWLNDPCCCGCNSVCR